MSNFLLSKFGISSFKVRYFFFQSSVFLLSKFGISSFKVRYFFFQSSVFLKSKPNKSYYFFIKTSLNYYSLLYLLKSLLFILMMCRKSSNNKTFCPVSDVRTLSFTSSIFIVYLKYLILDEWHRLFRTVLPQTF